LKPETRDAQPIYQNKSKAELWPGAAVPVVSGLVADAHN
jgi:hypothetical protein